MSPEEVINRLIKWKLNEKYFNQILPHALQRLETFSDFIPLSDFLFQ